MKTIGTTPSDSPVEIPEGAWWSIAPITDPDRIDWYGLADEMKRREVPGFTAAAGTDHKDIAHLKEVDQLRMINFSGKSVTDKALAHLEDMPNLKLVVLYDTNVTEEGIEKLRNAGEEIKVR